MAKGAKGGSVKPKSQPKKVTKVTNKSKFTPSTKKKDYLVSKRKPKKESAEETAQSVKTVKKTTTTTVTAVKTPIYQVPRDEPFIEIEEALVSRVLYPNPVCFLTTISTDGLKRNVMTLSWITPANNYGGFVFCIHKTRHSAASIAMKKDFCLSVATSAQIDMLLAVGKQSGRNSDKFDGKTHM